MFAKTKRLAFVVAGLVCALPAKAEQIGAEQARHFVAGKFFTYSCFEGTNGSGRIYADGSVAGYIQVGGSGPRRFVVLPANTLRVRATASAPRCAGCRSSRASTSIAPAGRAFAARSRGWASLTATSTAAAPARI